MIGRMKDRITRLEAHLDVHREQRKQLLPAWLQPELEGQGWLFDSYRMIFVPKHVTHSNLRGTGHDSHSTEQDSSAMRRFTYRSRDMPGCERT